MLGLHRHLPLALLLSACSQAPIGLGSPQDPSSFRATAEALQADWLRIDIADTFTGESWWSFLPEGRFQETYRRHGVVEGNVSTRRAEGSYRALEGGDLLIEWTDSSGGMQRQQLTAAIVRGDSPAPEPDIPSYLDGAERLVPAARRLTTRAFVSSDGLRYRRFSSVEVKGANSPAVVQTFEVIVELDAPLSALARGEAVNAEVTVSGSYSDGGRVQSGSEHFISPCQSAPGIGAFRALGFKLLGDRAWWKFLEDTGARDRHPSHVIDALSSGLRSPLFFDPAHPEVIVDDEQWSWRWEMAVPPPEPNNGSG